MRILFASAHPHLPQIRGGAQITTHEIALELIKRGHQVSVLAGLSGNGVTALRARVLMKGLGRKVPRDHGVGYPVYRTWFAWEGAEHALAQERPDVVFVQSGQPARMGLAFQKLGARLVLYLHNVEFYDHGGPFEELIHQRFVANSHFTAERYRAAYGIQATVVPPFFRPEFYVAETTRQNVAFVNPHPLKGVDVALEVARLCPHVPFSFIESWRLPDKDRAALEEKLRGLPNVAVHWRIRDMRKVYGRARIVLIPSKWEEGWGRIASEAHFNGIPAIAARVGGLPEAVGPGGVLIDPDASAEVWAKALDRMWTDQAYYAVLSAAALAYSRRPELNGDVQIDTLISVLGAAAQA